MRNTGLITARLVGVMALIATLTVATTAPSLAEEDRHPAELQAEPAESSHLGEARRAGVLSSPSDNVTEYRAASPTLKRQAFVDSFYRDTCDDAGGSPLDLRRLDVAEDTEVRAFGFFALSCNSWDRTDFQGRSIEWNIFVPGGRADGPDYAVVLHTDPDTGAYRVTVLWLPSADPATWEQTYTSSAERIDPPYGLGGVIPYSALDNNFEFAFGTVLFDPSGAVEDFVPQEFEDALLYPSTCSTFVDFQATVQAEEGHLDRALTSAREAGFEPVLASEASDSFEVRDVTDAELAQLEELSGIELARRPVQFRRFATPDDPYFPDQWALAQTNAPRAWDRVTSSGLRLAVIDDGVDATRPDLSGRVAAGLDAFNNRPLSAGANSDRGGHGTAVAGVAAASGDDGHGLAGVDWGATIVPYRIWDAADCTSDNVVARAIEHAASKGVPVINLSVGTSQDSQVVADAVSYARQQGSLVIASVGNGGLGPGEPTYPAAYPGVVGVGATQQDGTVASYSNRGDYVDIVAPGGSGAGSLASDVAVLWKRDSVIGQTGTSFAAPHVAAAALLYKAQQPAAGPDQIANALSDSATDLGAAGEDVNSGHGLLDLAALLGATGGDGDTGDGNDGNGGGTGTQPEARTVDDSCPEGDVPEDGLRDAEGTFHEGRIDCLVWWGVSTGDGQGGYSPSVSVSRAQMARFIARLIAGTEGQLPNDPPNAFPDDDGSVHHTAINQLAAAGIVGGKADGGYHPGERITRGQMATFLVRAVEHTTGQALSSSSDYFEDDDGTVHEPRINRSAAAGFTGGTGVGYEPLGNVTRSQMATFLVRILDLLIENGHATVPGGDGSEGEAAPDLSITDIVADPDGEDVALDGGEYIEVQNDDSEAVSLDGWTVHDGDGNTLSWCGLELSAGDSAQLYTGPGTNGDDHCHAGEGAAVWNNDGDTAELVTPGGTTVDSMTYP